MILRQILHQYVPRELIDRRRRDFAAHCGMASGSLREWAEELLGESRLRHDAYFPRL